MARPAGLKPDGQKIRRLRVDAGITAGTLARRIGRHPESIYKVEAGRRMFSDVMASQLARALGVTVSDIIQADPEETGDTAEPASAAVA